MALQFINHSFDFADYVCFILPQLFESDGKGVPRRRVKGFHLIYSEKINSDFLDPQDNKIKVNCIFQIWSKHHHCPKYDIQNIDCDEIKIYSLSDGGTSSTTRNKNMLYSCDVYLPSTCFGKENMRSYHHFDDLPGRRGYGIVLQDKKHVNKMKSIDWGNIAFLSTNSAFNLRRSQIFEIFQKL